MKPITFFLLLLILPYVGHPQQVDGSDIFSTNCSACHTIGGGQLVGPDLKGVTEKYEKTWITRFIRSSQTMVAEGDEKAVAVFNANYMIPMPDAPLGDEEIDALLEHISKTSRGQPTAPKLEKPKVSSSPKTASAIISGLSKGERNATFKSMMTGFWIAFGAFTVMGIGIYFAMKNEH